MSDPALLVEFKNVGLKFHLVSGQGFWGRRKREEFWPVRHLSFQLNAGDVLALVGRNGAGKTLCSSLMTGVYKPTEGDVTRNVQPLLLSLGLGFNPNLTCRENIRISSAHMGIDQKNMSDTEAEILEYAELDRFADQPVKILSSGMRSRLMFSVAVHQEPEVLILDEVLTTGDRLFREKAMNTLKETIGASRATVIVSHSEGILRELSTSAIWLENGTIRDMGPSDEILDAYRKSP